ncbi:MAG: phosphoribosylformylglycinamidine cyclo-ligase [Deltaproteobacteria bacterium]|nr:phosphoribosylformylglycinamidine cyclo-ligase [Deltaproteobacteria bacterium]
MTTYKEAGVDIEKADAFVKDIASTIKQTWSPEVKSELGDFAALYSLLGYEMKHPVLVSSTDGVGTKLKIAITMDVHNTVGIDLVAMCVNDILVKGARPLFFLDYMACGELDPKVGREILEGIARGCEEAECSLVGGETAEMPGMYAPGDYDLAGFVVGIVEDGATVDGTDISSGDVVIGVASSGLHSNGFSLVRKIVEEAPSLEYETYLPEFQAKLGELLLTPTRIYVKMVKSLLRDFDIKGMAHITGGGIVGNCVRILPNGTTMRVKRDGWEWPPVFDFIQKLGKLTEEEMYRTFNCGIGFVLVVSPEIEEEVLLRLKGLGETAFVIGDIIQRNGNENPFLWV